jgi:hypothetical protein
MQVACQLVTSTAFSKNAENTTGEGIKLSLIGAAMIDAYAHTASPDEAKTAMSKTLIRVDFSGITLMSLESAPLQGISFATCWQRARYGS